MTRNRPSKTTYCPGTPQANEDGFNTVYIDAFRTEMRGMNDDKERSPFWNACTKESFQRDYLGPFMAVLREYMVTKDRSLNYFQCGYSVSERRLDDEIKSTYINWIRRNA